MLLRSVEKSSGTKQNHVSKKEKITVTNIALLKIDRDYIILLDLAESLHRLTASEKVATALGSVPASSDTVESEARQ